MKSLFKALLSAGSRINIDGRDIVGRSVVINGDRVIVDGVEQSGSLVGPVSITITGGVERLETASGDVEVSGSCGSISTVSGDVICRDVSGSVSTMSGDIECGAIGGSVSTMSGDIRQGRR